MDGLINYTVDSEDDDIRIDVFISKQNSDLTRSHVQKLIHDGNVTVNGIKIKSSYKTKTGDKITVQVPEPVKLDVKPENIDIDILYEDDDIVVVNKPQGMVVHPAAGNYTGTLVNALLEKCKNLSSINGVIRPGIVHRIDKDTSGILVVAKNDIAHIRLAEQIKEHTMKRVYVAVVEGKIKNDDGTVDEPIGRHPVERKKMAVVENGRRAVTHYHVIDRFPNNTLIEARLETGRTHQIRVHMAYIGHPLVGDPVYGYKKQRFKLNGQALHAKTLGFIHPTKNTYVEFNVEPPEYFKNLVKILKSEK